MRILLIGSGAREHALAQSLAADPVTTELHASPGNPGIAKIATCHPLDINNPLSVATLARTLEVDLVVIGPEGPLVTGAADAVRGVGIACFGPSEAAAQLECSKTFAKTVMADAGVLTAGSFTCT